MSNPNKKNKKKINSIVLLKNKIFVTIVFIPFLYLLGWIFSQSFLFLSLSKEALSLIGTIFTFLLFIFLMPTWFNYRWEIRNSWSTLGLNNKTLMNNILSFSQGIIFALILLILILIPLLTNNYISFSGVLSSDIILNGILLTFGIGVAEEIIFRGWLLEDLKLQFGIKIALISQSVVFSLVHIGFKMPFWNTLGTLIGLFTLGILCSIIRLKDEGSLWGAIGLHGGLVGIWFVLNNGLINVSKEAPGWLVGYGSPNTNPLGGFYGISLLLISCVFYFLKFKNQIFKFIK
jgi:membrane protease YdiL (CAAX protease family)